jgi:hypothetical protein
LPSQAAGCHPHPYGLRRLSFSHRHVFPPLMSFVKPAGSQKRADKAFVSNSPRKSLCPIHRFNLVGQLSLQLPVVRNFSVYPSEDWLGGCRA